MIDLADALRICHDHYPSGPEALAAHLGIEVVRASMSGCDGWCLRRGSVAKVRLNQDAPLSRQRFTLAHELAHLIQGTEPDLQLHLDSMLASDEKEERAANQLAAEMLLPRQKVEEAVNQLPVDAATLKRLARQARVSEIMAACRVASLATDLKLVNAAVLGFVGDQHRWTWSKTLKLKAEAAAALLVETRKVRPKLARFEQSNGTVATAFCLGSDEHPAVFVQFLPPEVGRQQSRDERLRDLDAWLFGDDAAARRKVAGSFGFFKDRIAPSDLDEAVELFNDRYLPKWAGHLGQKMRDPRGQEYIRLRLSQWFT